MRTGEDEEPLAVADGGLQAEHAAQLRHGLHHEHARHDGQVGEVAGELRLVVGDLTAGTVTRETQGRVDASADEAEE